MLKKENCNQFVNHLNQVFKSKKTLKPNYSFREFAFELDYDPSTLHKILSGKRTISERTVLRLAKVMRLQPEQLQAIIAPPAN